MLIEQKMIPENWKIIPNYSRYEISTSGSVRHKRHMRILKFSKPYNGYHQVGVFNDILQKRQTKCVHQLMALTFLGEKPKGFEVAHKDDNKTNNYLSNLCYLYWRFNRIPKKSPIYYCLFCKKEIRTGSKKHCSKECLFLDTHTLLTCQQCGRKFYRKNSIIKRCQKEHGYILGKTYCSKKCYPIRKLVKYKGKQLSIAAWARKVGLTYNLLYHRIHSLNWPIEKALTQPICKNHTLKI